MFVRVINSPLQSHKIQSVQLCTLKVSVLHLVKKVLTNIRPILSFCDALKHLKNRCFLIFSGDIDRKHRPEKVNQKIHF